MLIHGICLQDGSLTSRQRLYDYRARYYDAGVGKFISEDPIGFEGGDGNFYRYAVNNPISNIDPLK